MSHDYSHTHPMTTILLVGIVTGIGQLFLSEDKLSWRLVIGRAATSGALGLSAGIALAWMPAIPFEALVGLSAAVASLGTSGLERLLQRFSK